MDPGVGSELGKAGVVQVDAAVWHCRRRNWGALVIALAGVLLGLTIVEAGSEAPGTPAGNRDTPWTAALDRVDAALARQDVGAAEWAWHEAYAGALRSWRWDALVEVGDAYLRIGAVAKGPKAAAAKARELYFAALFRARRQEALDGVTRVCEAFVVLRDAESVERCLQVSERLAHDRGDATAYDRVATLRERWPGRRLGATSQGLDPLYLIFPDESVGP
jgi:hypothetical protein